MSSEAVKSMETDSHSLAAALVKRGDALLGEKTAESLAQAVAAYDAALALIKDLPMQESPEHRHVLAIAWMHRKAAFAFRRCAPTRKSHRRG